VLFRRRRRKNPHNLNCLRGGFLVFFDMGKKQRGGRERASLLFLKGGFSSPENLEKTALYTHHPPANR
jgi:hypothetical protein